MLLYFEKRNYFENMEIRIDYGYVIFNFLFKEKTEN